MEQLREKIAQTVLRGRFGSENNPGCGPAPFDYDTADRILAIPEIKEALERVALSPDEVTVTVREGDKLFVRRD